MATKQCSKCNTDFECKAEGSGCWCEGLTISCENLQELRNDFDNCLCPDCLSQYAAPVAKDANEL